ncbi:uncharacterized protein JN550_009669 [Neoarthrinium moseri]|uniref:uncharacterized protein n=1 Tax=Neoarthrinium moseri TaxID=1658444 RepID=UPI001FDBCC2A|nr:uncharacterized protein JN550_009669 [Neoarthrinium moseri]KAI1863349.1 hypothetical protein JN550_009669 [Neoarthrinium moseri]
MDHQNIQAFDGGYAQFQPQDNQEWDIASQGYINPNNNNSIASCPPHPAHQGNFQINPMPQLGFGQAFGPQQPPQQYANSDNIQPNFHQIQSTGPQQSNFPCNPGMGGPNGNIWYIPPVYNNGISQIPEQQQIQFSGLNQAQNLATQQWAPMDNSGMFNPSSNTNMPHGYNTRANSQYFGTQEQYVNPAVLQINNHLGPKFGMNNFDLTDNLVMGNSGSNLNDTPHGNNNINNNNIVNADGGLVDNLPEVNNSGSSSPSRITSDISAASNANEGDAQSKPVPELGSGDSLTTGKHYEDFTPGLDSIFEGKGSDAQNAPELRASEPDSPALHGDEVVDSGVVENQEETPASKDSEDDDLFDANGSVDSVQIPEHYLVVVSPQQPPPPQPALGLEPLVQVQDSILPVGAPLPLPPQPAQPLIHNQDPMLSAVAPQQSPPPLALEPQPLVQAPAPVSGQAGAPEEIHSPVSAATKRKEAKADKTGRVQKTKRVVSTGRGVTCQQCQRSKTKCVRPNGLGTACILCEKRGISCAAGESDKRTTNANNEELRQTVTEIDNRVFEALECLRTAMVCQHYPCEETPGIIQLLQQRLTLGESSSIIFKALSSLYPNATQGIQVPLPNYLERLRQIYDPETALYDPDQKQKAQQMRKISRQYTADGEQYIAEAMRLCTTHVGNYLAAQAAVAAGQREKQPEVYVEPISQQGGEASSVEMASGNAIASETPNTGADPLSESGPQVPATVDAQNAAEDMEMQDMLLEYLNNDGA